MTDRVTPGGHPAPRTRHHAEPARFADRMVTGAPANLRDIGVLRTPDVPTIARGA